MCFKPVTVIAVADNRGQLDAYERLFGPFVHMSQAEKSVWLRFLIDGGSAYAPFQYDVRVGDGLQMPADSSEYAVKAAMALTRKRIDVLFRINDILTVCEVKYRAGLGAIGQLIGYRDLVKQTPGFNEPIGMLLVCDSLQPDMTRLLSENNINYVIPK